MKALPKAAFHKVTVIENNEPLAEITETKNIKLLKEHRYLSPFLRQTVRDMLYRVADSLPRGHKLLIVTAHRPQWMQKELWRQRVRQMTWKYPLTRLFRPKEFKRRIGLYTAPVGGSPHQCGAAVDLTLIGPDNNRLDMGTSLTSYGEICHTDTELITDKQRSNRRILFDAMTRVGFINYPLEWWHFSYGDRTWAAYSNKKECFYGFIDEAQ